MALPPRALPTCELVYCLCRSAIVVYSGQDEAEALEAAELAGELGARFVDSRYSPFVECDGCGRPLDFSIGASELVM